MKANFVLKNKTAERLYEEVKDLPIIDYHCHLSAKEIYEDKNFGNITNVFLAADHYKWRLMRSYGIDEKYITGDADDFSKFEKYIECVSYAVGSPLYAWTVLELHTYFDYDGDILPEKAREIYDVANKAIREKDLKPSTVMKLSKVEAVCTIEEAFADLKYHELLLGKTATKILPAFRGDKIINVFDSNFAKYVGILSENTGVEIKDIESLLLALDKQLERFSKLGCVSADFAYEGLNYVPSTKEEADEALRNAMSGKAFEGDKYVSYLSTYLLDKCYKLDFGVQLHFGAIRNNNEKMYARLGADSGYDSISDVPYLHGMRGLLNSVDEVGKTVIFNLNPADNAIIATFCGNFVSGGVKGKVQPGAAWWFNDHLDGMTEMLKVQGNLTHLATNVGMLTDSRSFTSYPRHDYFRRILCTFLGKIAEEGEFTDNFDVLKKLAKDISYFNAKEYFGL